MTIESDSQQVKLVEQTPCSSGFISGKITFLKIHNVILPTKIKKDDTQFVTFLNSSFLRRRQLNCHKARTRH